MTLKRFVVFAEKKEALVPIFIAVSLLLGPDGRNCRGGCRSAGLVAQTVLVFPESIRVAHLAMGTVDRAQPRHLVAWELCQYFVLWNSRKTCYIEWVS